MLLISLFFESSSFCFAALTKSESSFEVSGSGVDKLCLSINTPWVFVFVVDFLFGWVIVIVNSSSSSSLLDGLVKSIGFS